MFVGSFCIKMSPCKLKKHQRRKPEIDCGTDCFGVSAQMTKNHMGSIFFHSLFARFDRGCWVLQVLVGNGPKGTSKKSAWALKIETSEIVLFSLCGSVSLTLDLWCEKQSLPSLLTSGVSTGHFLDLGSPMWKLVTVLTLDVRCGNQPLS